MGYSNLLALALALVLGCVGDEEVGVAPCGGGAHPQSYAPSRSYPPSRRARIRPSLRSPAATAAKRADANRARRLTRLACGGPLVRVRVRVRVGDD